MIDLNAALAFHRLASQSFAFEALPSEVTVGVPLDISLMISPEHPSNRLLVERTSNGRGCHPCEAGPMAATLWPERSASACCFRRSHLARLSSIGPC